MDLKRSMAMAVTMEEDVDDEVKPNCAKRPQINLKEILNLFDKDLDYYMTPMPQLFQAI